MPRSYSCIHINLILKYVNLDIPVKPLYKKLFFYSIFYL